MKRIACTYIGHATTLIEMGETHLLTDPHFGPRTLLVRRRHPLPITPETLPEPQAVLLSHAHFDHLHIASYKYLSCGVPIIVPEGCERAVGQYLSNPVIELSPFATHELTDGTEILALPTEHGSGQLSRFRFRNANNYLISRPNDEGRVFFCGDSAYGSHFRETGKLGAIDLALLPIGGYEPRWFMRNRHMTPGEAVQAFEDLQAQQMIPIHHGTFRLSCERPNAPAEWLENILLTRLDLAERIHLLKPGQRYALPAAAQVRSA